MRANPSLNRTALRPPVSSVPVLVLIHKSETLVLVSQGDELVGGKQNRIVKRGAVARGRMSAVVAAEQQVLISTHHNCRLSRIRNQT